MLAVLPYSGMKKDGVKTCCQNQTKKAPLSGNKTCGNMVCNPFMSCCNGQALTTKEYVFKLNETSVKRNLLLIDEKLSSSFLSAPWHPPKGI